MSTQRKQKTVVGFLLSVFLSASTLSTALSARPKAYSSDVEKTTAGDVRITPIYHACLMLEFGGKIIIVDPAPPANLSGIPKADLILVTHTHEDHMDRASINKLEKPTTVVVAPGSVAKTISEAQVIANGQKKTVAGISIEGVPMYNLVRGEKPGTYWHDKGDGNGYILTVGGKRIYISGDTECTPEMKGLKNIDVAFICMDLPYTMTPPEAAACVQAFRPKIVYPYHFDSNTANAGQFAKILKDTPGVEIRLRKWY